MRSTLIALAVASVVAAVPYAFVHDTASASVPGHVQQVPPPPPPYPTPYPTPQPMPTPTPTPTPTPVPTPTPLPPPVPPPNPFPTASRGWDAGVHGAHAWDAGRAGDERDW